MIKQGPAKASSSRKPLCWKESVLCHPFLGLMAETSIQTQRRCSRCGCKGSHHACCKKHSIPDTLHSSDKRKERVCPREWQWGSRSQEGSECEPTGRRSRKGTKSLTQRKPG